MKKPFFFLLLIAFSVESKAVNFQYRYNDGTNEFRMWVPPTTNNVRGVFLVFSQMMDNISLDSSVRAAATIEDLAIVWSPSSASDTGVINSGLSGLATISGFAEVKYAPVAIIGHSTSGLFALNLAYYWPKRVFGSLLLDAVSYSPYGTGVPNSNISQVPIVMFKGTMEPTCDNFLQARDSVITRMRSKGYLAFVVTQPGAGHFGFTKFNAGFISMFLQKAAHYQIPYGTYAKTGPIALTRLIQSQGALADTTTYGTPLYAPASYGAYAGPADKAFWFFDQELANTWYAKHKQEWNKLPQTLSQSSFTYNAGQCNYPTYWSTVNGGNFTISTGQTIPINATATSGLPVAFQTYYGIVSLANPNVVPDAARMGTVGSTTSDWITVVQGGNAQYQVCDIPVRLSFGIRSGASSQTITYTANTNKNINNPPFPFVAPSAPGGAVSYYLVSGSLQNTGSNWAIQDFSGKQSQVWIRYGQNGSSSYSTAQANDQFVINNARTNQTVTFQSTIVSKNPTDAPFTVSAVSSQGFPVTYSVAGPATVSGNTVTLTGAQGTVIVLATAQGDTSYNSAKATMYITVGTVTGIKTVPYEENSVNVYPNPTHGLINITGGVLGNVNVKNILGETVKTVVPVSGSIQLNDLKDGVYFLEWQNTSSVLITRRVVKM